MKRKVIKIDKDGKEMKDKKGNYIFEEIEVEEPKNDPEPDKKANLTDVMNAINELKDGNSKLTIEEIKKMIQEVNSETNPNPGANPPAEPTIADLIKSVEEYGKKLGTEPGIRQLGNQPPAPEPVKTSLGYNPRTGTID